MAKKLVQTERISTKRILHYYLIKAYVNRYTDNKEEAEQAIDTVLKNSSDAPGVLTEAYRLKYYFEKENGNLPLADEYLLKYVKLEKELLKERQGYQLSLLEIRYQLKAREVQKALMYNRWMKYFIISLMGFIVLLIVFIIYRFKTKKEKSDLSHTLVSTKAEKDELAKRIKVSNLRIKFRTGKSRKNEWDEFYSVFKIRHPFFEEKLKLYCVDITRSEINYCICIYEGKSVAETAQMLNITQNAVKKARKNIKEKIGLVSTEAVFELLKKINMQSQKEKI